MIRLKLREEGLSWREIDDEVVALDVETATYLSANASGRLLWRSLSAGATREELVSCLVDEFEIDTERAAADVDAFIGELSQRGLLEG
jgi:orotate phosphoribosyltransferase-like protein